LWEKAQNADWIAWEKKNSKKARNNGSKVN
jgi:hypothetical protein